MEQYVGTQFIQYQGENLKGNLDEDVQKKNGLNTFISAATRRDSNIA